MEPIAPKPFSKAMRSGVVGPATRGLLGALLFLLTTRTAKYFAWTIEPPLTAAVLGANYLGSTLLAILASREPLWAQGRISISVALVFSPIMTAATFIHLGTFHLHSSGITMVITWFWLIAYGLYPIQLAVLLVKQLRIPGGDPPRTHPLPFGIKAVLAVHAAVLLPMGVLMFAAPGVARPLWPWNVPALSMRALAAWSLAFGVLALHAIIENDVERVKVVLWGYPILGVLHIIALVRFGEVVQWGEPGAWMYVAFLVSTFVLGAYGLKATRRPKPKRSVPVARTDRTA
ncbi:MAG TPA: hypothetical protein DIT48_00470 [Actinobacteria bacterium]|nr:hypothetical protein [Actinomycetota bacterium]HCP60867.1 hypothetical protein [Actinomycetota bacterium]